jgi:heterodisulfide reductase subunit A-like polyferredoxin
MVPFIDEESCIHFKTGECRICAKACQKEAINHDDKDEVIELDVGSIILATGFKSFDASLIPAYGYGRFDNVITALEFERLVNASGQTDGKIKMANGEEPKAVGIVHCVGSRDVNYNEYCSHVCCMYSLKFAHLIPLDMVILSTGLEPGVDHNALAKVFNISCSQDTFFLERHPKLADKGIFALEPVTVEIDEDLCAGCQMCVGLCLGLSLRCFSAETLP